MRHRPSTGDRAAHSGYAASASDHSGEGRVLTSGIHTAFGGIDAAIVVGYLVALAAVGIYFSRRQQNIEEFFLARRSMAWLPVGLSLMAALNSGIDYLMQPSATIRFGIVLLAGTRSWIFLYPWVSRITLPFYRRMHLYTAYEFLEARFDLRLMILVLGALVTLYTMLGGIQAVIWNDVIQFCIMFGGLGATVWIALTHVPGGVAEIWAAAQHAGKTTLPAATTSGLVGYVRDMFMHPITLQALVITMVLGRMASYTSDQAEVQTQP